MKIVPAELVYLWKHRIQHYKYMFILVLPGHTLNKCQ